MGDEPRFNGKWDFRRKYHGFDDSSSDDPDLNSTQDPIIQNPNLVDSDQIDNGTKSVTTEQLVKTRKRKSKKEENKPEKAKQVRRRKPRAVCAKEDKITGETVRKPKAVRAEEDNIKGETVTWMDDVGMFMETLLNDLTASRERLMDWLKTESSESSDQNVASQPPLKKRAVAALRSVKKRTKKKEDEAKRKLDENGQEMNKPNGKSSEIVHNGGDLDCYTGSLDRFCNSGQGGLGRNYFQQQVKDQQALVAQTEQTEMDNLKNQAVKSQKSIVLAIKAPILSQRQKKISEANSSKNRSSMVERTGSEMQKDLNFMTPYAPQLSSSSLLESLPQLPASLFPSSSQENNCLASNTNFQLTQPVAQIPDLIKYQTGVIEGQAFGNSVFHNNSYSNGYFSGFPAAYQPNLYAGSYNFPAQVDPATSSQQRDNNSYNFSAQANPATSSQQRDNNSYNFSAQANPATSSQQRDNNSYNFSAQANPATSSQQRDNNSYNFSAQANPATSSQQRDNNIYNFPAQVNLATSLQQRDNNSYNIPAQVNPATSSQQRDRNNVFGGLRMTGGDITFSGNRFLEADIGSGINSIPDYRTSSGR